MKPCIVQVAELEAEKKAEKIIALAEEVEELEEAQVVKNGSRDRFGNLRKNVGGRPKKVQELTIAEQNEAGGKSNSKRQEQKQLRQELRGGVQLNIIDEVCELAKGFGESASERTEFWKAAKPIIGDLDRKRVKQMVKKRNPIAERVEEVKAGLTGKLGRGYNRMNQHWEQHVQATATRQKGAGRKWFFGAHQAELQRWHEEERDRGHAVDKTDLQHE